jgi:hypothetical protein
MTILLKELIILANISTRNIRIQWLKISVKAVENHLLKLKILIRVLAHIMMV